MDEHTHEDAEVVGLVARDHTALDESTRSATAAWRVRHLDGLLGALM